MLIAKFENIRLAWVTWHQNWIQNEVKLEMRQAIATNNWSVCVMYNSSEKWEKQLKKEKHFEYDRTTFFHKIRNLVACALLFVCYPQFWLGTGWISAIKTILTNAIRQSNKWMEFCFHFVFPVICIDRHWIIFDVHCTRSQFRNVIISVLRICILFFFLTLYHLSLIVSKKIRHGKMGQTNFTRPTWIDAITFGDVIDKHRL